MNTAFFHDSTVIKLKNNYYSSGQLNDEKFMEYKKYFGNMTAIVKVKCDKTKYKNIKKYENQFKNVKIIGINPNYKNVFKTVKNQILKCDFAIIRLPSIIGSIACKYARKYNKPYLVEMVGCPRDALWYHGGIKQKIFLPIMYFITKREVKLSKYTIYVTKKFLQNRYPTKGKQLSCSDVQIYDVGDLNTKTKKIEKAYTESHYKFGMIGSLNLNYKGHETAIKALGRIKNKINFELHFLGEGEKSKWITLAKRYGIEKCLYFDGIIPHNEVYKWFDNMDFFLNPSLTEGLPRALIEAMSRGCLCIGTKVGGIPELLDEKLIIMKKNDKELSNKIEYMINNFNFGKEQIKRNLDISNNFQLGHLNDKKEKFYKEILGL